MTLPVDYDSDDYEHCKTLNMDVQLKPLNNKSSFWDIQFENGDYVNLTGKESLYNAICIAIMTRFQELGFIELYSDFGCRVYELIKANKSSMVKFKVQTYTQNVLENMRRVREVNWIEVSDSDDCNYKISFSITSISDEIISGGIII